MTAPDAKAVEAALHDLDAAHRCIGSHTFAPDTMRTLEAAARAYLATQKAEPVACAHIFASTLLATLHPSNAAIGAFEYADAMFAAEKKS
jgi:hypothetical protein